MPLLRFVYDQTATRDLDLAHMMMSDAEACETYTGWTEEEWRQSLAQSKVQAIRFAWWLAGKRAGETERYSEIDLDLRLLDVEFIDDTQTEVGSDAEEGHAADLPTGPDDNQEGSA